MRKKRILLLIIILVAAGGSGYGAFSLFAHAGADSLTVSELVLQADSLHGQQIRVEGVVASGSINWDSGSKTLSFALTDNKESLAVVYEGVVPDNFKPGTRMTVEGKHGDDGVFEATRFGGERSFCSVCH